MRIILLIILSFTFVFGRAQTIPTLTAEHSFLITDEIGKRLQNRIDVNDRNNFQMNDTVGMIQIKFLYLTPDTINNTINFQINPDHFYVFFPSREELGTHSLFYLFMLDTAFRRVSSRGYSVRSWGFNKLDSDVVKENVFLLELFPKGVFRNEVPVLYFMKKDGKEYIIDRDGKEYNSLDNYIIHNYGSIQDYMQTYKRRLILKLREKNKF